MCYVVFVCVHKDRLTHNLQKAVVLSFLVSLKNEEKNDIYLID